MPYLTSAAYVTRFGITETSRLTADQGAAAGTVDYAKVDGAINDASAYADSYIGRRYQLPLALPLPPLLGTLVGDLAREGLHPTSPPPRVTEAADRARDFLKDVGKGAAQLPLATGAEPTVSPAGFAARTSGDRRASVFTPDTLAGFDLAGPVTL